MGTRFKLFVSLLIGQSLNFITTIYKNTDALAGFPPREVSDFPNIRAHLQPQQYQQLHEEPESGQQQHQEQEQSQLLVSTTDSSISSTNNSTSWCTQVQNTRQKLSTKELQISYPCENLTPAKSAIVCVLTGGAASREEATRKVFAVADYVDGALALGASLMDNIDHNQTHMLLLVREGFELSHDDKIRVEAVGWTVGMAPDFPLEERFVPSFQRYKTTYSKLTVVGLEEYDCAMMIDADALAVGDLRDLMTCDMLLPSSSSNGNPQHQQHRPRMAAALDLSGVPGSWMIFNSGVLLWRTEAKELDRLYELTRDESFMKSFSSDQAFLNHVYPERLNYTLNRQIAEGDYSGIVGDGQQQVVPLPFGYNAQTHVEVRKKRYWKARRADAKILHFTERKGWQCPKRYRPLNKEGKLRASKCNWRDKDPICNCIEGYLWWQSLSKAKKLATSKLLEFEDGQ